MADILPFKRKSLADKHRGNTLCRNGHHRWRVDKNKVFDVKQGRLVSVYQCTRCGLKKNTLD
ncbi:MAG: hypothetical protein AB1Y36_03385 [Cycloclasticus sp.]